METPEPRVTLELLKECKCSKVILTNSKYISPPAQVNIQNYTVHKKHLTRWLWAAEWQLFPLLCTTLCKVFHFVLIERSLVAEVTYCSSNSGCMMLSPLFCLASILYQPPVIWNVRGFVFVLFFALYTLLLFGVHTSDFSNNTHIVGLFCSRLACTSWQFLSPTPNHNCFLCHEHRLIILPNLTHTVAWLTQLE